MINAWRALSEIAFLSEHAFTCFYINGDGGACTLVKHVVRHVW